MKKFIPYSLISLILILASDCLAQSNESGALLTANAFQIKVEKDKSFSERLSAANFWDKDNMVIEKIDFDQSNVIWDSSVSIEFAWFRNQNIRHGDVKEELAKIGYRPATMPEIFALLEQYSDSLHSLELNRLIGLTAISPNNPNCLTFMEWDEGWAAWHGPFNGFGLWVPLPYAINSDADTKEYFIDESACCDRVFPCVKMNPL